VSRTALKNVTRMGVMALGPGDDDAYKRHGSPNRPLGDEQSKRDRKSWSPGGSGRPWQNGRRWRHRFAATA
jgi:hypothetical protein